MKIGVVTPRSKFYEWITQATDPNKEEYCQRHGYVFCKPKLECSNTLIAYQRFVCVRDAMQQHDLDFAMLAGGDVIFTNFNLTIESRIACPTRNVIIARDALMVQSDVGIYRNSKFVNTLIDCLWGMRSTMIAPEHPLADQDALELFIKLVPDEFHIVPQRFLQSYEYSLYTNLGGNYAIAKDADGNDGQWQVGDFALHVPAHMQRKVEILKAHLPMVIK